MNKLNSWLVKTKPINRLSLCNNLMGKYRKVKRVRNRFSIANFGQLHEAETIKMLTIGAEFNKAKYWFMKRIDLEDEILKLEEYKKKWGLK